MAAWSIPVRLLHRVDILAAEDESISEILDLDSRTIKVGSRNDETTVNQIFFVVRCVCKRIK